MRGRGVAPPAPTLSTAGFLIFEDDVNGFSSTTDICFMSHVWLTEQNRRHLAREKVEWKWGGSHEDTSGRIRGWFVTNGEVRIKYGAKCKQRECTYILICY
jgi:hypothetical protein